jgi:hypothetical protein
LNLTRAALGIPLDAVNPDRALEETIKRAQLENSKQQTTMLRLTIATAFFAFGALVLSLIQLRISVKAR